MGYQWRKLEEGIRVREHPTRKHGIKSDLYFVIRYQKDGKRQEESLGWASQGMTLHKARLALAQLREAARTGNGATSLRAQREEALAARKAEQEAAQQEAQKTGRSPSSGKNSTGRPPSNASLPAHCEAKAPYSSTGCARISERCCCRTSFPDRFRLSPTLCWHGEERHAQRSMSLP